MGSAAFLMEHLSDGNNAFVFEHKVRCCCYSQLPDDDYARSRALTLEDFWKLPNTLGWSIDENGEAQSEEQRCSLDQVTQRWLWFEVLAQVFGDLPQFRWNDFIYYDPDGDRFLNTKKLPQYVAAWLDKEKSSPDKQRTWSLIRIQQVLNRAKHFVSKYCAVEQRTGFPHWPLDPLLSLSYMVLGETLMHAQTKILKAVDGRILGWYSQDSPNDGWGYSGWVLEKLKMDLWCAKAVFMLQALLKGNSIGLLYLRTIRDCEATRGPAHQSCTLGECRTKAIKPEAFHYCTFASQSPCLGYKNVDTAKLAQVVRKGNIPVFQWDGQQNELRQVEMNASFDKRYVIFSHVWVDGFGSCDKENRLNTCVLDMFSDQFDKINQDRNPTPKTSKSEMFWIDTLSIPAGDSYQKERTQAIRQMHKIYTHAQYTIVLDKSLMNMYKGSGYSGPAMKILMSRWMTRMWTLQEAVLSRQIYFKFKDQIYSIDQLENLYIREAAALHTCVPKLSQLYYHGILGEKRDRVHKKTLSDERWKPKALFIAMVWKAAQWRSTEHRHHETLSLATLLNVEASEFAKPVEAAEGTPEYENDCDQRMHKLLFLLSDIVPCPLPPGMIFLPGPRLTQRGYGWAPKTWLSSCEIDAPDPLSATGKNEGTRFDKYRGLEVDFPGFLLHHLTVDRNSLRGSRTFQFPTDSNLLEWYSVAIADADDHFPSESDLRERPMAILASRIQNSQPKYIALLVVIQETHSERYYVGILNRVWLSREKSQANLTNWSRMFREGSTESICAGERLPATQKWCVDGFNRQDHDTLRKLSMLPPPAAPSQKSEQYSHKILRALTWKN